jgi:uncharacterized membrane protein
MKMLRVVLFHLYVALMALLVLTASQVIADHYGSRILGAFTGTVSDVNHDVSNMKNKVKNWNKNMLD